MQRVEAEQRAHQESLEECEYLRTVVHATSRPPAGNMKQEKSSPSFALSMMPDNAKPSEVVQLQLQQAATGIPVS
eukprot:3444494-Amphidinium_carterae.1